MHLRMSDVEYLQSLLKSDTDKGTINSFVTALSSRAQIELVAIILLGRGDLPNTRSAIDHAESLAFSDSEYSATSIVFNHGIKNLAAGMPLLLRDGYRLQTDTGDLRAAGGR